MTPPTLRLLAIAAATATVAGCGSDGSSQDGAATTVASTQTKAVKYSQCMRAQGVRDFPDPDAEGQLTIDAVANDAQVDVGSAAFEQATRACKALQPSGFTGGKRTPKQQAATLRFAACIRAHGVKDFPDPAEGQPPVDTNRIPSANEPGGMAILNAAMKQCGSRLGRGVGGRP